MFAQSAVILFAALMIWAAVSDIRRYILSNRLCLAVVLLYPLYLTALYTEFGAIDMAHPLWSLVIALALFGAGMAFFAMNVMGGGDVKLIPGVALWAGPALILDYLMIMALSGGVIAGIILVKNRLIASKAAKSSENINFSVAKHEHAKVPYGIGIALGGLYVAFRLYMSLNGKA